MAHDHVADEVLIASDTPRDATPITRAQNLAVLDALPFDDVRDFEDARRGFLGTLPDVEIKNAQGRIVWSLRDYAFLEEDQAPPTVNPSLWRQARLNMHHGLFQVTDRIYQIRGFDISNMTIIEGDRGLIVIDPLISTEVARAGLDLYVQHRGRRPVTTVIYTHSHTDHYGGVRGVVDEAEVTSGRIEIIAPDRFMEEVVSEAVLAGPAMVRRAQFQFGATLPKGPRGQVDAGLGKVTSRGTVTLIPPTRVIREPIEVHHVDGIEIVFQMAPETEAPAEMHMFYPGLRALNLAENATHNLHNIYPIVAPIWRADRAMSASFQSPLTFVRHGGSRRAILARTSPTSCHDPAVGTTTRPSRSNRFTSSMTSLRPASSTAPARSSADTTEARTVRGAASWSRPNEAPPSPSRSAPT